MTLQNSLGYGLNHDSARYISLLSDSTPGMVNAQSSFPSPPNTPYPSPPKPTDDLNQMQPPSGGAPQPPSQPKPPQMPEPMTKDNSNIKLIGAAIAVIVIIGIIYFVFAGHQTIQPTTVTTTNSISLSINSCTIISSPGTYQIGSNINTGILNGSCITITSSNVNLNGMGHIITGSGPFIDSAPYTYGISLTSVSNVNINDLSVSKFSYGIYLNNSNHGSLTNLTLANITVAGIFLAGSQYNLIRNDRISSVNGQGGGISIQNGGNNTVSDSSMQYNSYYGMVINSSGNRLNNLTLVGNPVDLMCGSKGGYISYNKLSNSTCYINEYCNFAMCSESNIQSNPQSIVLQPAVTGCGSIRYPGKYSLSQNINTESYVAVQSSGPQIPCITVNSSNVNLNCNGYSIDNGPYGVYAHNSFNLTVTNCGFDNNTYGIYLSGMLSFKLHNITANNGVYGVYAIASTGGNFTNVDAKMNTYGIYVNGSTYTTLTRFNTTQNQYGIAVDNSTSVSLDAGSTNLNTKTDLYCTASSYNSTLSTVSDTACASTDCIWGFNSCPIHSLPSLAEFPVSSCTTISLPGQYSVNTNLISQGTCFRIEADNVSLQCNSHTINGYNTGDAVVVTNATNVALFNCRIQSFAQGVLATNVKYLVAQNLVMNKVNSGINITNGQGVIVSTDTVSNFSSSGFSFTKVNKSVISMDVAELGLQSSIAGFAFSKSTNNTVINNTALRNFGDGFSFQQATVDNFIKNNTASQDNSEDYVCSPDSSGLYANTGNINNGIQKTGCEWLAVIPTSLLQNECTLYDSPSLLSFQYDGAYTYGGTCYTISSINSTFEATHTVINCNGHTIVATDGGTFVMIQNTSYVTVENCILLGFSTPIVVTSKLPQQGVMIINDTIGNSNTSISSTGVLDLGINNNNISRASTGIAISYANSSTIQDNLLSGVNNGIIVSHTYGASIVGNQASATGYAIQLLNTTGSSVQSNNAQGTKSGIYCSVSSNGVPSANSDHGSNVCSSNSCSWITSSTSPACK